MFGRRRRPLLGAAVIAGTATVASRHGARKQSEMEAQRQFEMEQQAEFRRNQEERERIRNQEAIDRAVSEAMAKQPSPGMQQGSPAPMLMQPAAGPPPIYGAAESYVSPGPSPYLQPGAVPPRPRSTSAADSGTSFCSGCGNQCGAQDNFCNRCGRSLAGVSYEQPAKQGM